MQIVTLSASGFALLSCVLQLTTLFQYQPVCQIQEVVCSCPEPDGSETKVLARSLETFVRNLSLERVVLLYPLVEILPQSTWLTRPLHARVFQLQRQEVA